MYKLITQISKNPINYLRLMYNIQKVFSQKRILFYPCFATNDQLHIFTLDLPQRQKPKVKAVIPDVSKESITYCMDPETLKNITEMSTSELDTFTLDLMAQNKDKQLTELIINCMNSKVNLSDMTLKKLFRNYSVEGRIDMVDLLQKYCAKVDIYLYKRNGEFQHYLAKAQCMKGNSDKGLSILKDCYIQFEPLRSFYRIIFRELIQDSVLNRSEASLVIFKKYVLEFSERWGEHYPLVCFWHICWSSSWFSDQMLSNELLELSEPLQNIVRDKAIAFSVTILRQEYNEDAVIRLLQALIKYDMMAEYAKVLQVFFSYKIKNRDIRGCTEIVRNCEALGISLPSDQQGRYIKMLIDGKYIDDKPTKPPSKNFKLKF